MPVAFAAKGLALASSSSAGIPLIFLAASVVAVVGLAILHFVDNNDTLQTRVSVINYYGSTHGTKSSFSKQIFYFIKE
jgi:hypothetical protein